MPGIWETFASLPSPLTSQGSCAAVGGNIHCIGGRASGVATTVDHRIYDITTNTWSTGVPAPDFGVGATAVADGNKIYCILPGSNDLTQGGKRLYVYDALALTWTRKASCPNEAGTCQPVVTNGKIYVPCPQVSNDNVNFPKRLQIYDIASDTWTVSAATGPILVSPAVLLYNNKIFCAGGEGFTTSTHADLIVYDIATDTWTSVGYAQMPRARTDTSFGKIDNKLWVTGGKSGNIQVGISAVDVYDPVTNTWDTYADVPQPNPRVDSFFTVVGNETLHIMGGRVFVDDPQPIHEGFSPDPKAAWQVGSIRMGVFT